MMMLLDTALTRGCLEGSRTGRFGFRCCAALRCVVMGDG